MQDDYGPLPFDVPHRLVTSFIYELPWGSSRKFQVPGALGAVVNDWSVNGILSLNSGLPFSISSTDRANAGPGRNVRADCAGDPVPDGFEQTLEHWFDTSAFATPALFTHGNCGYNSVRGPSSKTMNMSVFRSVPLGATRRLELRMEMFNVFNWTNFGFPASNVSNAGTFGTITSSLGDPREMQFAVKFYF
jgi:hypothetical protein